MSQPILLKAHPVLPAQAILGEGALWDDRLARLMWVDIERCQLHRFDPRSGQDEQWKLPAKVSTVVPDDRRAYLVALANGIHAFDPEKGTLRLLANPITNPEIRFNDGKCDPEGRFWAGTIHSRQEAGMATLYRLDPDGTLHTMLRGLTNSNGLVWTGDRQTFYFIDTPTQLVQAFDFDPKSGALSNPRRAVMLSPQLGAPDGMTIDANDHIWVALYGGGAVHAYDPLSGVLRYRVEVAAPHVTSCAFGGKDLKTLFITTARQNMSEAQLQKYPHAGDLFAIDSPVAGVPAYRFG